MGKNAGPKEEHRKRKTIWLEFCSIKEEQIDVGWAIWLEKNVGGQSDLQRFGGQSGLQQRGRTNKCEEETKNADEQRNDLTKR